MVTVSHLIRYYNKEIHHINSGIASYKIPNPE